MESFEIGTLRITGLRNILKKNIGQLYSVAKFNSHDFLNIIIIVQ